MPHVRRPGLSSEDAAAEFLAALGFTLLRRRFKAGAGEIDLIALEGSTLAFVEVKERRTEDPLDAIDPDKQSRIVRAAKTYLATYEGPPCEVRYDVVSVTPKGITLHRDAFCPR